MDNRNLKWLTIGIGVKRWLLTTAVGILGMALGLAAVLFQIDSSIPSRFNWQQIFVFISFGFVITIFSLIKVSRNLLAPFRRNQVGRVVDVVYSHSKRHKGVKVVAIGGGTGLPSVLRGLKAYTSHITAIVTVADDGGSSGRLRRDLGVLPPGDIRNNIVALADDESLMAQLFQYRFSEGDLDGHAFGNLFIAALAGVSGGLEIALPEVERVLNIQGRVLPSTLDDMNLVATITIDDESEAIQVEGESKISNMNGHIERISILPLNAQAYFESVNAILDADLVAIGPGSLYTSILPNLLVKGIGDALRATKAHKVYICNVATQPGETQNYSVADHVVALEEHIGRGMFQTIVANDAMPTQNAGENTHYVTPAPINHEILQRYEVHYADLTDWEKPWRHDPQKLAKTLLKLSDYVSVSEQ
jgi:uncharacterized cofD-like protein